MLSKYCVKVLYNSLFNMSACVSNGDVVFDVYRSRKPITTFNLFGTLKVNVSSSERMKAIKKPFCQKKIAQKSSLKKKAMKKAIKKDMNPSINIVFSEKNNGWMPTKMSLSDFEHYLAIPKNWLDDDENHNDYFKFFDLYDFVVRYNEDRNDEAKGALKWLCNSEKIDLGVYEDPYVLQSVMKKVPLKGMYYLHEFDTLF